MLSTKVEYLFVVINPEDNVELKLNIAQSVHLACFIAARFSAGIENDIWRFIGKCSQYKSPFDKVAGYGGTFNNYTLDLADSNNSDAAGSLRYGTKVRTLSKTELMVIYSGLIKHIAKTIPGIKFPSSKIVLNWKKAKVNYTGFGFTGDLFELGYLREFVDGAPTTRLGINQGVFIGNRSIARPDFISDLCFGTEAAGRFSKIYHTIVVPGGREG